MPQLTMSTQPQMIYPLEIMEQIIQNFVEKFWLPIGDDQRYEDYKEKLFPITPLLQSCQLFSKIALVPLYATPVLTSYTQYCGFMTQACPSSYPHIRTITTDIETEFIYEPDTEDILERIGDYRERHEVEDMEKVERTLIYKGGQVLETEMMKVFNIKTLIIREEIDEPVDDPLGLYHRVGDQITHFNYEYGRDPIGDYHGFWNRSTIRCIRLRIFNNETDLLYECPETWLFSLLPALGQGTLEELILAPPRARPHLLCDIKGELLDSKIKLEATCAGQCIEGESKEAGVLRVREMFSKKDEEEEDS